jgi:RNA polymerase sigma factor (sigma-70 family)
MEALMANRTSFVDLAPVQVISLDALAADAGERHLPFDFADPAPGVDEQIERAEAVGAIHQFIRALTQREQEIVWRIYWLGETQTAVASRFGVSKMAVSKTMNKISARGRTALKAYEHHVLS